MTRTDGEIVESAKLSMTNEELQKENELLRRQLDDREAVWQERVVKLNTQLQQAEADTRRLEEQLEHWQSIASPRKQAWVDLRCQLDEANEAKENLHKILGKKRVEIQDLKRQLEKE